jgi:hypothetical protein
MATIDLGKIKMVWRGAYNNSTAYTPDDVVSSGGTSYICILASTGNAVTNTTYWNVLAEGGDVASTLTTQGDVLFRDGSGLQRLAKGTAGQALTMNSGATAPEWGTISSGTYSVHAFDEYQYGSNVSHSGQTDYIDIAGGNTVTFTPTSTDDLIQFNHHNQIYAGSSASGADVYINFGTSSTLGSSDTKVDFHGQHNMYGNMTGWHFPLDKTVILPCTGLTVGTQYYAEQAGSSHSSNAQTWNNNNTNNSGRIKHYVQMIHFKKN